MTFEVSAATDAAAPHRAAADALRTEADAMDRLCAQLAWTITPKPVVLDAATLRAVADLLDTLET